MQKGIYAVGFPSPDSMPTGMWQVIEPSIKQDQQNLRKLVRESCELVPLQKALSFLDGITACKLI